MMCLSTEKQVFHMHIVSVINWRTSLYVETGSAGVLHIWIYSRMKPLLLLCFHFILNLSSPVHLCELTTLSQPCALARSSQKYVISTAGFLCYDKFMADCGPLSEAASSSGFRCKKSRKLISYSIRLNNWCSQHTLLHSGLVELPGLSCLLL